MLMAQKSWSLLLHPKQKLLKLVREMSLEVSNICSFLSFPLCAFLCQCTLFNWGTGWTKSLFDSQQGQGISLFSLASRSALVSTHPPVQEVLGALFWAQSMQGMHLTAHLRIVPRFLHYPIGCHSMHRENFACTL